MAHVVSLDHGAEPFGGGDGLQTRHARTDDQHLRRADGARGGGEHGQKAIKGVRSYEHGFVAGDRGLRGQGIHGLRPRDPRDQFHGEGGDPALAQRLDLGKVGVRLHEAHHHCARLERLDQRHGRRLYREEHVGLGQYGCGSGPFHVAVTCVRKLRTDSGAMLEQDSHLRMDELVSGLWDHTDAHFRWRALFQRTHNHRHSVPS